MPHALDLAEARKRVEEAARDLSEGSLKRTNPMIEAREQNRVVLKGRSDRGSHFEAEIEVKVDSIEVAIKGALVKMGAISPDQLRSLFRAVDYRVGRNEDKDLARVILDSGYAEEAAVE